MHRVPPAHTDRARTLRTHSTEPERILWRHLSPTRPRVTRQFPAGPYILDFACRSARLGIELDGQSHQATHVHDAHRTAWLQSQGWRVLRFTNAEVRDDPEQVTAAIAHHIEALAGEPVTYVEPRTRKPRP